MNKMKKTKSTKIKEPLNTGLRELTKKELHGIKHTTKTLSVADTVRDKFVRDKFIELKDDGFSDEEIVRLFRKAIMKALK